MADVNVLMRHPKIKVTAPARTTREAFETVWKPKGWEEVIPDALGPAENAETATDASTSLAPTPPASTPQTAGRPGKSE